MGGYARIGLAEARLTARGYTPDDRLPQDAKARAPRMHRKTQLFVTRETLAALARDPRTQDAIANQETFKDARGMMTDGEVLQVTAGPWALWVVSDMWMLAGSTTSRSPRCAWAVGRSRHPATGRPITGAALAGDRLVMRTQHRLYSIRRPRSG